MPDPQPNGPFDRLETWLSPGARMVLARETPIPTIAQEAARRIAAGSDLVRADIGQIAGYEVAAEVLYGPPAGLPELREAVAGVFNRTYGLPGAAGFGEEGLGAANVAVTSGAAEALALLFRCFARERVVGLPRAHWENYANGVALGDGREVMVDFFDGAGRFDAAGLARQVEAEGIRILVVNFPCNPTGAVVGAEELDALAAVAREHDLLLLGDEVYARLRFDGEAPRTLLRHAPERTVVVSSGSKEYLLPGARVGWAVCADERITARLLPKVVRSQSGSPNVPGQRLVLPRVAQDLEDLRAGREPARLVALREAMRARRDALVATLRRHGFTLEGRAGHEPMGTIFLMAGIPRDLRMDDVAFARAALEADCVSTVPGSSFGMPGSVRFSFGSMTPAEVERLDAKLGPLLEGLRRVDRPGAG